jgi:hypothetical protein
VVVVLSTILFDYLSLQGLAGRMQDSIEGVLQCGHLFPATVLGIFRNADMNQDGIVSGNEAVEFFASTGVDKKYLHALWERATDSKPGGLTPAHFSRALRLVSLLQTGCDFTDDFIAKALHPTTGLRLPDPKVGSKYMKATCADRKAVSPLPMRSYMLEQVYLNGGDESGSSTLAGL